jgi:hypothetical protein
MRESRRERVVQALNRVALSLVHQRDFSARGDFRLRRIEHAGDEIGQHLRRVTAGAFRLAQMPGNDLGGASIALEHQVFAIRDVVVHGAASDAELGSNFRQRRQQHSLLIELPGSLVEHALVAIAHDGVGRSRGRSNRDIFGSGGHRGAPIGSP